MKKKKKKNKKRHWYIKCWDLTQYNKELLKKYRLNKKCYYYVGSTIKRLCDRRADFKYKLKNDSSDINFKMRDFYKQYKSFCMNELKETEQEFENHFFDYQTTEKAFECISLNKARTKERLKLNEIFYLSLFYAVELLNLKDSDLSADKQEQKIKEESFKKLEYDKNFNLRLKNFSEHMKFIKSYDKEN